MLLDDIKAETVEMVELGQSQHPGQGGPVLQASYCTQHNTTALALTPYAPKNRYQMHVPAN